ncbi:MAG: hypothetical protein IPK66_04535 [Rhodospirillales bacterium]|nr:hypothetical protein [Rhodospirillales bacterium]
MAGEAAVDDTRVGTAGEPDDPTAGTPCPGVTDGLPTTGLMTGGDVVSPPSPFDRAKAVWGANTCDGSGAGAAGIACTLTRGIDGGGAGGRAASRDVTEAGLAVSAFPVALSEAIFDADGAPPPGALSETLALTTTTGGEVVIAASRLASTAFTSGAPGSPSASAVSSTGAFTSPAGFPTPTGCVAASMPAAAASAAALTAGSGSVVSSLRSSRRGASDLTVLARAPSPVPLASRGAFWR